MALVWCALAAAGCRPEAEEAARPEISATWKRKFRGDIVSLSSSLSASLLVVATAENAEGRGDDHLYVLDGGGAILWQEALDQMILKTAVAGDGSIITAFLTGGMLRAWNASGDALWEVPSVGVPEVSGSGQLITCWNTGEEIAGGIAVQALDREGRPRWSYDDASGVWDLALADGGEAVVLVTLVGKVVTLSGQGRILWKRELGSVVARVAISPGDAQVVAVGTGIEGETLGVYDLKGVERWSATVPGGADSIALSRGGRFVVVGNNTVLGQRVYVFDDRGSLFWKFQLDRPAREPVKVRVSETGERVVAALEQDGKPMLLTWDRQGEITKRLPVSFDIQDFVLSRDGSRIAAITKEGRLFYYVP